MTRWRVTSVGRSLDSKLLFACRKENPALPSGSLSVHGTVTAAPQPSWMQTIASCCSGLWTDSAGTLHEWHRGNLDRST